jgi:signal peptide peptidase SppA
MSRAVWPPPNHGARIPFRQRVTGDAMKQFPHILARLFYEPTLITPARHHAICQLVEARMVNPIQAAPMPPDKMPRRDEDMPSDEDMPPDLEQHGDTVIIPVHGTIVPHPEDIAMSECGCALEILNQRIALAEHDPAIERVIYDFRSPGGTVTGVPETGRRIRNSRKKTAGFCGSECCSGALWLAAQCQRFYATQSANVGSVGVYTLCLDLTASMRRRGVEINAISAGKYKLLGAPWKPLADDERAILQARVDKIYAQFKEAMESNRMVADEHFGNGLVFDGEEAVQLGFTDGVVEGMEDILEGMVE